MKMMRAAPLISSLVLAANSAIAQQEGLRTNTWNPTIAFITPLDLGLAVPDDDPLRRAACRGVPPDECPQMLTSGGNGLGKLPTLDPVLIGDPAPHVRVTFVLQRLYPWHTDVHSVTIEDLRWKTHSSVADQEIGEFGINEIDEQIVDANGYFFTPPIIYDALILNACDDFSSFPVSHEADFDPVSAIAMPFIGFDDSTIDSTGFYQFNYEIPVDGDEMGPPYETGLHMSGKISVTCTYIEAFVDIVWY